MLYNSNFLLELDQYPHKTLNIRITLLDMMDFPKEQIQGKATGGSINIDGASAVRRSCSLSLVAQAEETIITDSYWSYNNKFKLEIGLNNEINSTYPSIIWFDMGIYLISGFSKSKTTNNFNISIQGKDKMARLNGEISGHIMAGTDFGTEEIVDKIENDQGEIEYQTTIKKLTIPTIVRNALRVYGQERDENIIINDLDNDAFELWEYRGDQPMYLIIKPTFDDSNTVTAINVINMTFTKPKKINDDFKFYSFNTLDEDYNTDADLIWFNGIKCYVAKVEYGETAGYHKTDLVYNSDLILNAGETVTAMLDKLKAMLGDFEYFYDLQGRFVFQKKKTYIQELFSPINGEAAIPQMLATPYSYKFENENLFTAISNNPQINNIKNDFAVWGTRKGVGGADLPIHARCGIQKKPDKYISPWQGQIYSTPQYDYRELIYQMAIDFYAHGQDTDFLIQLSQSNPQFINGKTGYEQYYIDMQGFWRQLYDPAPDDWAIKQYGEFYDNMGSDGKGNDDKYWNKKIHTDPYSLNFWFEILDSQGDLNNYNIETIGVRSKVVNENNLKSIYYQATPEVQFIVSPDETYEPSTETSYKPIWIQKNMEQMFYRSSQGASVLNKLNDLIIQHTIVNESVTLTSIPIYYLQPNTRIYVKDQGDFTLDKISYNLNYNGTMSLTCNKIIQTLY